MLVAIIAGTNNDLTTMEGAIAHLKSMSVPCEVTVLSAHRCTNEIIDYVKNIEGKGYEVIITGAGNAPHLPGVIAANTSIPVIGVPIENQELGGVDSLLSILQLPREIPVANMTIGIQGALNAAVLAVRILGNKYPAYRRKADEYRNHAKPECAAKNITIRKMGFQSYMGQFLS